MGNLTSWNPLGHSRPVMGLLDLYSHSTLIALLEVAEVDGIRMGTK